MRELIFEAHPNYISYNWLLRERLDGKQTHVLIHRAYTEILSLKNNMCPDPRQAIVQLPAWVAAA